MGAFSPSCFGISLRPSKLVTKLDGNGAWETAMRNMMKPKSGDRRRYESPIVTWYGNLETLTLGVGPDKCDDEKWLKKKDIAFSPFSCILP